MSDKKVLSVQEERINEEIRTHKTVYSFPNRATVLLEKVKGTKPQIDIERGFYFTESFKETEGQPLNLRWAKALMHYAKNATVYIEDGQLLVGRSGKLGRYGILYPELDGDILGDAIEKLPERETSPFSISKEDAKIVKEVIQPYWEGKTYHEDLVRVFPEDTKKLTYNEDGSSRFIVNETSSFRSSIQWVHDYEIILEKGFDGIKKEALERLESLDEDSAVDTLEKKPFLEATIITCDAIVLWANRYAKLAEELAKSEKDGKKKEELLRIAENARRVPEFPPENFYQALQSQWFVQMFSRIEQKTGTVISNGRMDQYLYPYYKRDIEKGIITEEKAEELLECMWVGMSEFVDLYLSETGGAFNEGYAHWEAVTIGGVDSEGNDAVNELTYLLLKSKRNFPLNYPDLAARIHTLSPNRYLHEVAKTIKEGSGFPKLINDDEVIPLLLAKGAGIEEANDYSVSGCSECRMPNRDTFTSPCAYINFAAALEMTLYNGKMLKYGDEVIGLKTGEVEEFASFEEFLLAYLKQQKYFIRNAFIQEHEIIRLRAMHFASPLGSLLHKLCRDSYTDIHQPYIPGGIDLGYFEFIGYGTVIDSLAAIKKFVFEEKKVTWEKLKVALKADFEGYEDIRELLQTAPAYGNDDEYADVIGKRIDREALDFAAKYSEELGVHLDLRLVPFTSHVPFGKVVSATPNGRKAYVPLSDGSSASQGADKNGPTAVLLSNFATKNKGYKERASRLLNIKLSPSCVEGETGTEKLVQFIRAWHDLRLWHIQFNVLNTETLRKAQQRPEEYKNLLVRIAGYSAYFTELSKDLQDDIIARTEQQTV
ncbi:glycyl radical protein [Eubacterium sp. MSJ-13]|uniref:(2S)-3-sulfopropanediol dehydratase n=1 Tax=Eubacterium sp. MSJ-13 TaxID=2841513 RepID=UPI001C0FA5B2|nr:glycyl radical protein [Eubacterium sp. MSJ-13]MBU5479420.1 glycyl radical protein [Eubacterium sp. MSJ-13]